MATADPSSPSTTTSQEGGDSAEAGPSAQSTEGTSHSADPLVPAGQGVANVDIPSPLDTKATQAQGTSTLTADRLPPDSDAEGQVPLLVSQPPPSIPAGIVPATMPSGSAQTEQHHSDDKEKGSWGTSTLTVPLTRRSRRKDGKSASEGTHSATSTAETPYLPITADTQSPKKSKGSIMARIVRIFSSCVSPSQSTHPIDVEEGAVPQTTEQKEPEKVSAPEPEPVEELTRQPSSSTVKASPPALTVVPPVPIADPEVVVPPTPTKQLLPLSETDGLTSGAVQAPGSTGEEAHSHKDHSRPNAGDSGSESGSSFSEEEGPRAEEEEEDEEERLIRQGGNGIPIGSDGKPQPLLPPISPKYLGRKCLVLDLDETLVHSSLKPVGSPDFIVPVEIEYNWHNFYVLKRPGVDNFLKKMGDLYEVVVFTASLSKYADPVLDRLDPDRSVAHRLFRESCYNHRGNYVKDLSQLGRPVGDTIILDNSPASYLFHPNNAVPVSSWFNDPHDTELTDMSPFLADLSVTGDVRGILNPSSV